MYLSFYKFKCKPFQESADPRSIWLNDQTRQALYTFKKAILHGGKILLLTGNPGTGKTTFTNKLINNLPEEIVAGVILSPDLSKVDFLEAIANSFKISKKISREITFIDIFREYLEDLSAVNRKALLVVDEAQRLSSENLVKLSVISGINSKDGNQIKILLVGQPEFNTILFRSENRILRQKIATTYNISPLTGLETIEYIRHQLKFAGGSNKIFNADAVQEVFSFTGGNPRLINIICDLSLLIGFSDDMQIIPWKTVKRCTNKFILPNWDSRERNPLFERLAAEYRKEVVKTLAVKKKHALMPHLNSKFANFIEELKIQTGKIIIIGKIRLILAVFVAPFIVLLTFTNTRHNTDKENIISVNNDIGLVQHKTTKKKLFKIEKSENNYSAEIESQPVKVASITSTMSANKTVSKVITSVIQREPDSLLKSGNDNLENSFQELSSHPQIAHDLEFEQQFSNSETNSESPDEVINHEDPFPVERTVTVSHGNLRKAPSLEAEVIDVLISGETVTELRENGSWYFVKLADGRLGWTHKIVYSGTSQGEITGPTEEITATVSSLSESPDEVNNHEDPFPVERTVTVSHGNLRKAPSLGAEVIDVLISGETVTELRENGSWYFVKLADGRLGWTHKIVYSSTSQGETTVPMEVIPATISSLADADHSSGKTSKIRPETKPFQNQTRAQVWSQKSFESVSRGKFAAAIIEATTAISYNPGLVYPYVNRSWAYSAIGMYDKAIEDCHSALEIEPVNVLALNNMGLAHHGKKEYGKSIVYFRKSCEMGFNKACTNLNKISLMDKF